MYIMMMVAGCMQFSKKTDSLGYMDRYKAHTGERMASLAVFNVRERNPGTLRD
jgi:hypothetical protein